jgi:hypothetical protein
MLSITVTSILNAFFLSRRNKEKQDPIRRQNILAPYHDSNIINEADLESEEPKEPAKEANKRAWLDLGDRHPDFKYTL